MLLHPPIICPIAYHSVTWSIMGLKRAHHHEKSAVVKAPRSFSLTSVEPMLASRTGTRLLSLPMVTSSGVKQKWVECGNGPVLHWSGMKDLNLCHCIQPTLVSLYNFQQNLGPDSATADFFDGKHNIVLGGSWATHPRIAGRKTL